jgi:uncharacterized protein YjbI with pentapeptide repeats
MKIIKPMTLGLLTRPFEFKREFWLGVSVLAFLPVGGAPILLPETEMWPFLAGELPPGQALDVVIPKTRPEFLTIAHAFAPNGIAAPMVRTGVQLGPTIKLLDVYGDRVMDLDRGEVGPPVPFERMPIDWSRTYGGAGVAENPLGRGEMPTPGADARIFPVQNIINPKLGRDGARVPACFAPVDQTWPARARFAGTYDDNWLKQDFPGFARDIDWGFFNIAPTDQWLPAPLSGDESYAFKNLHPEQPLLKGRLPGMAPRSFLVRKKPDPRDPFEEVNLTLTTVWFFPHRERLVLVHHGAAHIAEEDGSDLARVVIGADHIGSLRPTAAFHAVMVKRADTKGGAINALRDEDLVPAEWLGAPPRGDTTPPEVVESPVRRALASARKRADALRMEMREQLIKLNLDPDKHAPPPFPPETAIPTLDELPAFAAAVRADAEARTAQAKALGEAKRVEIAPKLAAAGVPANALTGTPAAKPKGPPVFSAAAQRDRMTAQIEALRAQGTLTAEHERKLPSAAVMAQWDKAEAAARNGYRLLAHQQGPADAVPAVRSAEIRRLVATDTAQARAEYDLHGADLSGLDLSGIDLSGVCLDGANLTGASFIGARLVNSVLAHACMQGCRLDDADLSGASLGNADLTAASLRRAILKKAVLNGANLTNATLAGADLEGADLTKAIFAGADFSGVRAAAIRAIKLSLRGLRAPGILLDKAKFIECDLQGADLTGASLERAVFLESNLDTVRLTGANLIKAVFVKQCSLVDANLAGADLTGANLRETELRRANLAGAILVKADLSGANMMDAYLPNVRADDSRFVGAILRHADLRLSSFARADLARADLRGANLTGVSMYEANLPRVKLDPGTRRGGMFRTRTRYLPLYEPPRDAQA